MARRRTDKARIVRYITSKMPEEVSILELIERLKATLEDIITYNITYGKEPISFRSVESIARAFEDVLRENLEALAPEVGEDNIEAVMREVDEKVDEMLRDLRRRFYGVGS